MRPLQGKSLARETTRDRRHRRQPAADIGDEAYPRAHPIRLVVADEQTIDRKALAALLDGQPDFEIAGEAATTVEAVERCRALGTATLVLDTRMPDLDGVPAISAVRIAAPGTRVLALAGHSKGRCLVLNPPWPGDGHRTPCELGPDCLWLSVRRGATGAIRRSASAEDFFAAVRAVAAGNAWLETGVASRMAGTPDDPDRLHDRDALSIRDLEVAARIAEGRCNKEIGRALGISEPTVKKHVGRILERLGLQDRLQIGLHIARHPELLERLRTEVP